MDDEEYRYDKRQYIIDLIDQIKMPNYDKKKASELFYSMSELSFFDGMSLNPQDAEIIFKAFVLSSTLSDKEIKIIKM